MTRRKQPANRISHDRWLVSYADFITLLFAVFVVLYASSQVDKRKMGLLSESIQSAFPKLGVFDTPNNQIPVIDAATVSLSSVEATKNTGRTDLPMKDIEAELQKTLAPEISAHVVELRGTKEGLVISLREVGFYVSGSPSIRPSSTDAIDRLAAVLKARTESIRIEGHTDNVPIHNGRFESNWELSTERASDLIKVFVEHYGIAGPRLSAAGYAQFHPVSSNDTPEGRARNRRVDIVVLNPAAHDPLPPASPDAETPAKPLVDTLDDVPAYVPQ